VEELEEKMKSLPAIKRKSAILSAGGFSSDPDLNRNPNLFPNVLSGEIKIEIRITIKRADLKRQISLASAGGCGKVSAA